MQFEVSKSSLNSRATQHEKMSNHVLMVVIMVVASIFIGYYLTMTIILRNNKTDNRNKFYQSMLMGFWMGLVELVSIGLLITWSSVFTFLLIIIIIGIILFTCLIYWQIGINENQFMLSMQEHHQMAIEMTKLAKPKTENPELLGIMDEILESQQREIDHMQDILNQNNVPNNITSLLY